MVNILRQDVLYLSRVCHEYIWKNDSIAARILDLATRWIE